MQSENLHQALQSVGLRLTPQRIAICNLLAESEDHPTAKEIYALLKPQFPSLSLATVYNTLETLVELGAIHALGSAGDDTVHYDADTTPHVNLVCLSCHRIFDVENPHVNALEAEIRTHSGFRVVGANVTYYGLCPDCQQKEAEKQA